MDIETFWDSYKVVGDCWIWQKSINKDGYGKVYFDGLFKSSHRVAYELEYDEIPEGLEIDHLCRTRACMRPSHLEAVTHQVNVDRGDFSGNGEWQRSKTHCAQGHP